MISTGSLAATDGLAARPLAPAAPAYRAPAVDRAFQILFLLQERAEGLGVSEIARRLGIGKGPCFSILKALQAADAVTCDRWRKLYRLGAALVRLGNAASGRQRFVEVARREMARLARDLRCACSLSAPYGADRLILLARAERPEGGVPTVVEVGPRTSLLAGARGRALMAWSPAAFTDAAVRRTGLAGHSPASSTDPRGLHLALERARRQGFAESLGELAPGVNAVAAPIFDASGTVVLVLEAIGADTDLPGRRLQAWGRRLRRAAEAVTRENGGRAPRLTEGRSRR